MHWKIPYMQLIYTYSVFTYIFQWGCVSLHSIKIRHVKNLAEIQIQFDKSSDPSLWCCYDIIANKSDFMR